MPLVEASARSLHGHLRLRFDQSRRTRLTHISHSPPFQAQRVLFLDTTHPSLASLALLNASAGIFAGDRLMLDVDVETDAAVSLTTPTMARVFAMDEGHAETSTSLRVAERGYLEYLPQPTLLCAGAALHESLELDVQRGARVALGQVLCCGRIAYGERFAQRELRQRLELRFERRTVLAEALVLDGGTSLHSLGLVGGRAVYGNLHLFCEPGREHELLACVRQIIANSTGVWAGASLLHDAPAVGVRALGEAASPVQQLLQDITLAFRSLHCT